MIFSVPFMIIISAAYLLVPGLRNIHGKLLSFYLIGMIIGHLFLSYIKLANELSENFCKIAGFLAYFSFINGFLWLNSLNFDIWYFRGLKGSTGMNPSKRLLYYTIYSSTISVFLLILTITAQLSDLISPDWKPHIGSFDLPNGNICWFDGKIFHFDIWKKFKLKKLQ